MARLRKEKHSSSRPAKPALSRRSRKATSSNATLLLASGGDLPNTDNNATAGPSKHDVGFLLIFSNLSRADHFPQPALSKDIFKFLRELNLAENESQESDPRRRAKKHQIVRPQTDLSQPQENDTEVPEKSSKTGKKQNKAPLHSSDPPLDSTPKVQLPTKISSGSHFVFQPTAQWYTAIQLFPPSPASTLSPPELISLISRAAQLHTADMRTFQSSSSSNSASSEASFLFKIIQSGTLSDRLSALTLLVQSSPLHNTKALETLKGMAERGKGKGGREESLKALRCIVDWWVGGGAPDRKLK